MKTPCEKTPPTKRHTRLQSRRKLAAVKVNCLPKNPVSKDLAEEIEVLEVFESEEEEERCKMSKTAQDPEIAKIKSLSEMAQFFQDSFATLPTREYMDQRLSTIEQKADETVCDLRNLEKCVQDIEKDGGGRKETDGSRAIGTLRSVSSNGQLKEKQEEAFLKATRSIRIWPIEGPSGLVAKVDDFLKNALCMTKQDQKQTIIEDIYPVRSSPRSRNTMKFVWSYVTPRRGR